MAGSFHLSLKRPLAALAVLLASASGAMAAGTIPLSMTQQLDQYGVPLSGCQLLTIQAGTTSTPQNAYKDLALTQPQPNPMVCDSSGRLPQFFLADGQIKIRLIDKLGNPQVTLDNILVIGPSSGGGSGATIDPTTIATTGDVKHAYGTQVITGWVRLNGRTIGSAVSGATERANADTQALFLYLWAADVNLTVSGGRTTAAADFAANKTIALPDGAGRALSGLDDMGAGARGRLTATYFGTSPTVLGATGGAETKTMLLTNLPPIVATGAIANGAITSTVNGGPLYGSNALNLQYASGGGQGGQGAPITVTSTQAGSTFTGNPLAGALSTPFSLTGHRILMTIYIKM